MLNEQKKTHISKLPNERTEHIIASPKLRKRVTYYIMSLILKGVRCPKAPRVPTA